MHLLWKIFLCWREELPHQASSPPTAALSQWLPDVWLQSLDRTLSGVRFVGQLTLQRNLSVEQAKDRLYLRPNPCSALSRFPALPHFLPCRSFLKNTLLTKPVHLDPCLRLCFFGTRPKTLKILTPHFKNTDSQKVETIMKLSEVDCKEWTRDLRPS